MGGEKGHSGAKHPGQSQGDREGLCGPLTGQTRRRGGTKKTKKKKVEKKKPGPFGKENLSILTGKDIPG